MTDRKDYLISLTHSIQSLARDVEEMAPDLVGNLGLITDFEIRLKFPLNGVPTIQLIREHIGKNNIESLQRGSDHED